MPRTPRTETQLWDYDALDALEPLPVEKASASRGPRGRAARRPKSPDSEASGAEDSAEVQGMAPYRAAVRLAVRDEYAFANFKRDPSYRVVLEHVWPSLGAEYLESVRRDAPGLWEELEEPLRRNCQVGSPFLHEYPGIGRVSPTQLRYLKVLADLRRIPRLPGLDGASIVEFGVGYGGQCQLILAAHAPARYLLIDFKEVEQLAEKYLRRTLPAERMGAVALYQHMAGQRLRGDLFISNYAFSELRKPLQRHYFQEVVRKCRSGYVTYNRASDAWAMRVDEFAALLRQEGLAPSIVPETPYIAPDCWIVTW